MHAAMEILLALLCAAALLLCNRLIYGRLLFPSSAPDRPVFAVLPAQGDGLFLEQTLRHLLWLNREHLGRFSVLVVDVGLTPAGLECVRALLRKTPSLLFCTAEEIPQMIQREDWNGHFSR